MSNKVKIFLYILGAAFLVVIASIIYRLFFEFKNSDVKAYIAQEAVKYQNTVQATKIINDAVMHILGSYYLTKELRDYCAGTGIAKEQALVSAAIADANNRGYLTALAKNP